MRSVRAAASGTSPTLTLVNGGREAEFEGRRWGAPSAEIEPAPSAQLLALALDTMAEAALFVGRNGRIVYANRAARTLLETGTVLRDVAGHVGATDPAQRGVLSAVITEAAAVGVVRAASLVGLNGARVNLTAVPSPSDGAAHVLLLATEMRRGEGHIVAQLQQAFGLTAAEAAIANSLSAGDTPADIAQARGASLGTVQCQIKSIAAKLGTRRQTEIAAIVQAMPRISDAEAPVPAALAVAL